MTTHTTAHTGTDTPSITDMLVQLTLCKAALEHRKDELSHLRPEKCLRHTHEGSVGNLCNAEIARRSAELFHSFDFARVAKAENKLLGRE